MSESTMKKVAYSKSRLQSQTKMANAISKNLKKGEVYAIIDVMKGEYEDKVTKVKHNSDYLVIKDTAGVVTRLAVKEITRMSIADNAALYAGTEEDGIELPINFTVNSMEDRLFEGKQMFSTYAYKDAQKMMAGEITYPKMIENGLLDEHPFEALQDYTISVKH